ncbi:amino acid permease-domain-containing protein, partial [Cunninghamella echinulata]
PPSFAESEFQHIRHRQIDRSNPSMLKYSSVPSRFPNLNNQWEFAGWGSVYYMELNNSNKDHHPRQQQQQHSLGLFRATSIAGNDVIASVLYSSGPVFVLSGQYAAISMLLVSLFMYPVKKVMTEVITSLPLNGGTYNAMLHTTSKWIAAFCACFSILDYILISTTSSSTAIAYLKDQVSSSSPLLSPLLLSILIIALFCIICFFGIRESANVTLCIFTVHIITLIILMTTAVIQWASIGNSLLIQNWYMDIPKDTNFMRMIFTGFCIGLLGATGIEASENYVEEVNSSIIPKVMNNMYILLCLINAPLCFLITILVPIQEVQQNSANAVLLLAKYSLPDQKWLAMLVMVDSMIVLSACILTGLVGFIGLICRLSNDRILPSFFLRKNRFTGSYQYIIIVFFILNVILCFIANGDASSISGVFSIAFLGVLTMYGLCNLLMKYTRGSLKRIVKVSLITSFLTFLGILTVFITNIITDPSIGIYFIIYFLIVLVILMIMLKRGRLLQIFYWLMDRSSQTYGFMQISEKLGGVLEKKIIQLRQQPTVFFINTDEPHILNKAILYVQENEDSSHIKFVYIYDRIDQIPPLLETNHRLLDEVYPKIQIDLIFIQGHFNPSTVDAISKQLSIPKCFMFMACPGPTSQYNIGDFGGVRIIMV